MRLRFKLSIAISVLALASVSASSAEVAILQNGFSIRFERREPREALTRLYFGTSPNSYVEVATDQIVRFEVEPAEEKLPPAPPAFKPTPPTTLKEMVSAASSSNNLDPDLIMILIRAESGFNANAVSPKGALGLMQLMPKTALRMGVSDPFDPAANLQGGARYLRELLDRYHNDLTRALAAYNAGPRKVEQYQGVPPYAETKMYIAKVIYDLNRRKLARFSSRDDPGRKPADSGNTKSAAFTSHQQPSGEAMPRIFR
jgi:soluble lytic murein transglycosylase-like protein